MMALLVIAAALPECPPSVELRGLDADAAEVRTALSGSSVVVGPAPAACEAIVATVTSTAGRWQIEIVDAAGRHEQRSAPDARLAAQLIASWARSDLEASLLAPRRPVVTAPPGPVGPPAALSLELAPPELTRPWDLSARAELGASEDGALWAGASARGSAPIGPLGALAYARIGRANHAGDARHSGVERLGVDLLAGAELPFSLGPVELRPSVLGGLGILRSTRAEARPSACDNGGPGGGACPAQATPRTPDNFSASTALPLIELALEARISLFGAWSLTAGISGTASPAAHSSPFLPRWTGGLDASAQSELALAGEPRFYGRGLLGLAWEPQ
ncbi:MAG: hypothetical protein U1E65_07960 [Myxococcota bacterium]